jgi:hypothetical protein
LLAIALLPPLPPLRGPGQPRPAPRTPAAKWFPGGLYDTKYLAAQIVDGEGAQLLQDTGLGGLFDILVEVGGRSRQRHAAPR